MSENVLIPVECVASEFIECPQMGGFLQPYHCSGGIALPSNITNHSVS